MYVCNCNGLNEKNVSDAITNGASSTGKVFKHHGCKAQCGKCCQDIRSMVNTGQTSGGNNCHRKGDARS